MAINDILKMMTSSAPRTHRGVDITYTTSTGSVGSYSTTTRAGSSGKPSVGTMGIWDGTKWTSTTGEELSNPVDAVKDWANAIATEDNDMVYLRKKNGILYAMKVVVHGEGKWERLDPRDTPVITDMHGKNLEEKLGNGDAAIVTEEVVVEEKKLPAIKVGWYQDNVANLYKYNGDGTWDTDTKQWEKLLKLADSGSLEFIG